MSSLRNAIPRPNHKERSQTTSRTKWGLLEKHKDYSLRAADYNLKKAKLSRLRSKARDRNPDEFAFGMVHSKLGKDGRKGGRPEDSLGEEAAKLLKTQDAGYLRVVGQKGRRQLEKLEKEVVMQDVMVGTAGNADEEDGEEKVQEVQASKPKKSKSTAEVLRDLRAERKRRKRLREVREGKLEALKTRQKEIMAAADQLDLQRSKMNRTVGGVNKDGVKWKVRERKK